jgi:LysM repeat protein
MNHPNPFVPQGSVLEHDKRRSRMKLAVFCVLTIGVAGLTAMLIQGCKREQTETSPPVDTNQMVIDTNVPAMAGSNSSVSAPPIMTNTPPVVAPVTPAVTPAAATSEYTVIQGDTLGKIAKNNHVTVKALEDANPGVMPTKLKIGQKLNIPAAATTTPAESMPAASSMGSGEIYTVKPNDTLTKIAHDHGTTVKAIETANNLTTTKIKVGQKLTIPAKADTAAPAAPAPAPVAPPAPAAAAPTGTPTGQ